MFYGITVGILFGLSDLIAKRLSTKCAPLFLVASLQVVGLGCLIFVARSFGGADRLFVVGLFPWGAVTLVASLLLLGTYCLYRAIAYGPLLHVVPIAGSFAAITAGLGMLVDGIVAVPVLAGSAMVFSAAYLLFADLQAPTKVDEVAEAGAHPRYLGALYAVAAAVLHGAAFFLYRYPVEVFGPVALMLAVRIVGLILVAAIVAFLVAGGRRSQLRFATSPATLLLVVALGITDTLAGLVFNWGLQYERVNLVAVGIAVHPLVPVAFAILARHSSLTGRVVFLTLLQIAGMVLVRGWA